MLPLRPANPGEEVCVCTRPFASPPQVTPSTLGGFNVYYSNKHWQPRFVTRVLEAQIMDRMAQEMQNLNLLGVP